MDLLLQLLIQRRLGVALAAAVLAFRLEPVLAQTNIRVDIHGGPLPKTLSADGLALQPSAFRRACSDDEAKAVQPLIDLATKLVSFEGESRLMRSGSQGKTISDPATKFSATVVTAGKGYAIQLDTSHSPIGMQVIVPAIYECLTLAFGDEQAASDLGLPLSSINASIPLFSPSIGFYVVQ